METKELKIQAPDGYEVDVAKSTFENIVFKKKEEKRWRDNRDKIISGYCIRSSDSTTTHYTDLLNTPNNHNLFATEKQAKSALAMARISQIMANDERFGRPITEEEWTNVAVFKHSIDRKANEIIRIAYNEYYTFLAFHTEEQRDLFLKENEDLVKDYLMIE